MSQRNRTLLFLSALIAVLAIALNTSQASPEKQNVSEQRFIPLGVGEAKGISFAWYIDTKTSTVVACINAPFKCQATAMPTTMRSGSVDVPPTDPIQN